MVTAQEADKIMKKAQDEGYSSLTDEEVETLIEWKAELKAHSEEHQAKMEQLEARAAAMQSIATLAADAAEADLKEHLAKVEAEYQAAMEAFNG